MSKYLAFYITKGWTYISQLPYNLVVIKVKRPHRTCNSGCLTFGTYCILKLCCCKIPYSTSGQDFRLRAIVMLFINMPWNSSLPSNDKAIKAQSFSLAALLSSMSAASFACVFTVVTCLILSKFDWFDPILYLSPLRSQFI